MAKRRTKGRFAGEYVEDAGEPEEINAPIEIETDAEAGVVRTTVRETSTEVRGHRYTMAVGYFQQQLRRVENRDAYVNRPIVGVPKPSGDASKGPKIPAGYVVCPECGSGLADAWDCPRCEGRGIVRDPHNSESTL